MPAAGFTFIEQYRTMAKEMEQQSCDAVMNFVDDKPSHFLDTKIKTEIKIEAQDEKPDLYNMANCMFNNNSSNNNNGIRIATSNSNQIPSNFLNNTKPKTVFTSNTVVVSRHTPISAMSNSPSLAATTSSTTSAMFSSSTSPMMSSASLPTMSPFTTNSPPLAMSLFSPSPPSTKTSTYITGLGGSGCTVVSNNMDFLLENSMTTSSLESQDDSLQYTDLDKPSMYDDYVPFSSMSKSEIMSDESVPLEEAVFMMTGTLQGDCDKLGVPYDPLTWTDEDVRKWVSWVCTRNGVQDVSNRLYNFDGNSLCSLTHDTLSNSLGEAGVKISNELELLKAAYSCFPNQIVGSMLDDSIGSHHLCNPYMEKLQTFNQTACVSPAPSTGSSNHDSNTSTISAHSDHSDDESGYGSQISSYSVSPKLGQINDHNRISAKAPTGRGHKQTIHLWQFLKELLLSKDNNYNDCIRWLDRNAGVFKIEDSKRVASLWGARKNRPAMNYDKLSRSVRQYYKKGIIKKTEQSKRLVYQFCSGYM